MFNLFVGKNPRINSQFAQKIRTEDSREVGHKMMGMGTALKPLRLAWIWECVSPHL